MPNIPIPTAQAHGVHPGTPSHIAVPQIDTGIGEFIQATRSAEHAAQKWAGIAAALQDNQRNLDYFHGTYAFKDAIAEIHQDLPTDEAIRADPMTYEAEYVKRASKAKNDLLKTIKDPVTANALGTYADRVTTIGLVKARADGFKMWGDQQLATIDAQENELLDRAVSGNAADRDFMIKQQEQAIDKTPTILISERNKIKRKEQFKDKVEDRFMMRMAKEDPYAMLDMANAGEFKRVPLDRQTEIKDVANKRIHAIDTGNKEAVEIGRKSATDWLMSRALDPEQKNPLTEREIQDGIDGKYLPFISPQEMARVRDVQGKVSDEGSPAVSAVMTKYASKGIRKIPNIQEARKELDEIYVNSKLGRSALQKAYRELSMDEEAITARGTAEAQAGRLATAQERLAEATAHGNVVRERQQKHEDIRLFTNYYDSVIKPAQPPGMLKEIQDALIKSEIAQGSLRISKGENWEKVGEDILKVWKEKAARAKSLKEQSTKDLQDAAKALGKPVP